MLIIIDSISIKKGFWPPLFSEISRKELNTLNCPVKRPFYGTIQAQSKNIRPQFHLSFHLVVSLIHLLRN
jgi:hypothetical protein